MFNGLKMKSSIVIAAAVMALCLGCGGGKDGGNKGPVPSSDSLDNSEESKEAVGSISENAGVVWTAVEERIFDYDANSIWDISIAYGNDRFLVGGEILTIGTGGRQVEGRKSAYSPDGVTWTAIKNNIGRVTWAKDRFITLGRNAHSSDGITWTDKRNYPLGHVYGAHVTSIVWANNIFVAVGGDCDEEGCSGGIAYSSDGVNCWTPVKNNFFGESPVDFVVWGKDKFVAGVTEFGSDLRPLSKLVYSSDGITWAAVENQPFNKTLVSAIVWGKDKFVAGGADLAGGGTPISKMGYSSDGITWTAVENNPVGQNTINAVVWGGNKFVASGCDVSSAKGSQEVICRMAYSSDGITWTAVDDYPFGKSPTKTIAYGDGVFVAVSEDGKLAYSK